MDQNYQQLLNYIKSHHLSGTDPAVLKQQLLQAGWDDQIIEQAISHAQQNNQPINAVSEQKTKPPIAAQILYFLGFISLIFGLAMVAFLYVLSSDGDSVGPFKITGLGLSGGAAVFVLGTIIVGVFTLINFIRSGKKWALITYTALMSVGLISVIYDLVTQSEIEKIFNDSNAFADLFIFILVGPLLAILWTRNRDYFK